MAGKKKSSKAAPSKITEGAVPAEELKQEFPRIALPVKPPYPPMEAKLVDEIPRGDNWQYEPKWDGFRCVAFRKGEQVLLQSKAGQPLGRYFPEIVAALQNLKPAEFVLDGEIVILQDGHCRSTICCCGFIRQRAEFKAVEGNACNLSALRPACR